jgi:hypothetical protein
MDAREIFAEYDRRRKEREEACRYEDGGRMVCRNGWLARRVEGGWQVGYQDPRHPDGECWFDPLGGRSWAQASAFAGRLLPMFPDRENWKDIPV